ncbi:MAG: LysM peptidoglycan-binding domain-containing protein [Cyclonatronaceae bacterium]
MRIPILFVICLFVLSAAMLPADPPTHIVRQGETLFSISRQYDVTVGQLREWNGLSGNVIQTGQELVVGPGERAERESPAERSPERRDTERETEQGSIIHTVEAGQTLFRISQIYGVSVEQIRRWNDLPDNLISIGQELEIRRREVTDTNAPDSPASIESRTPVDPPSTDDSPAPSDAPAADEKNEFADPDAPSHYEVRPGDTLYRIASLFNMTVQELMDINNLENTLIEVGQQLRIRSRSAAPPSVTEEWDVESTPQGRFVTHNLAESDTLHQLLQHHNMDIREFRALNQGVSANDLRPGDEITLLISATTTRPNPYLADTRDRNGSRINVTRYPDEREHKTTTSGDLYNPDALTAAHPSFSLGSVIFVTNPDNEHGIFVHINDRTAENRLVLSHAAFRALGFHGDTRPVAEIKEINED